MALINETKLAAYSVVFKHRFYDIHGFYPEDDLLKAFEQAIKGHAAQNFIAVAQGLETGAFKTKADIVAFLRNAAAELMADLGLQDEE